MLANLLPGLRQLRAPLAAGYLWLLVAWLLLHGRVETGEDATGAVRALLDLKDEAGPAGLAAAASFLAYVVGALWEPVGLWTAAWLDRLSRWLRAAGSSITLKRRRTAVSTRHVPGLSAEAEDVLAMISRRLFREVDEVVCSRFGLKREDVRRRAFEALRDLKFRPSEAYQRETIGTLRDRWWRLEGYEVGTDLIGPPWKVPAVLEGAQVVYREADVSTPPFVITFSLIRDRLVADLPLVARSLIGVKQEVFSTVDRMRSEVEFRFAVALPLALTWVVFAHGLALPTWGWLLLATPGIGAGVGLILDGRHREREANHFLVHLLRIGTATSSTFDRLLKRAADFEPGDLDDSRVQAQEAAEALESPPSIAPA